MKKTLGAKLTSFIVALVIFTGVFATTGTVANAASGSLLDTMTAEEVANKYSKEADALEEGFADYAREIPVTFDKDVTTRQVQDVFTSVLLTNPEFFFVAPQTFSLSIARGEDEAVVIIYPNYLFDTNEIDAKVAEFIKAVTAITDKVDANWTAMKKCRFVHDMIALGCRYYTATKEDYIAYTAYGALVNGTAYCQGYALAYNYILETLGVSAEIIVSNIGNHAWSMVNFDNNYYHVDVTFDDALPDTLGKVTHDLCLVNDAQLKAFDNADKNSIFGHQKWVSDHKATDGKYNNAWWKNIETAIYTVDGKDYYVNNDYTAKHYGALLEYNDVTKKTTEITKITDRWYVPNTNGSYYKCSFTYLVQNDGYFYFNGPEEVYRVAVGTKNVELFYTATLANDQHIYGMGNMQVAVKKTPNKESKIVAISGNVADKAGRMAVPAASVTEPTVKTETPTVKTAEKAVKPKLSKTTITVKRNKTATVKLTGKLANINNKYTNTAKAKITSNAKATTLKVKGLKKGITVLKIKVNNNTTLSLTVKIK